MKRTLPLHAFNGEPYYLGAFLIGAYQEILGDMHNLFGDTNAVHVSLDANGSVVLETVIKGDTRSRSAQLRPVRSRRAGPEAAATDVEVAVRESRLDIQQAGRLLRFYEDGLHGYTYLEDARDH